MRQTHHSLCDPQLSECWFQVDPGRKIGTTRPIPKDSMSTKKKSDFPRPRVDLFNHPFDRVARLSVLSNPLSRLAQPKKRSHFLASICKQNQELAKLKSRGCPLAEMPDFLSGNLQVLPFCNTEVPSFHRDLQEALGVCDGSKPISASHV